MTSLIFIEYKEYFENRNFIELKTKHDNLSFRMTKQDNDDFTLNRVYREQSRFRCRLYL